MLAAHRFIQVAKVTPAKVLSTANSNAGVNHLSVTTANAFTPAASALILVAAHIYNGNVSTPSITVTDTLGGLTWHEVTTSLFTAANFDKYRTALYWAVAPSSPTSGNITLTSSVNFTWLTIANVIQVPAGDFNPAAPVAQQASALIQNTTGDGTTTHTLTATLGSAPSGTCLAVLSQHYTNTTTAAAPGTDPDYTHLDYFAGLNSTVECDIDVGYAETGSRQSVTWSGLVESAVGASYWYYGLLVELQQDPLSYDDANTYYGVALSANHSFDHVQTWAFTEQAEGLGVWAPSLLHVSSPPPRRELTGA